MSKLAYELTKEASVTEDIDDAMFQSSFEEYKAIISSSEQISLVGSKIREELQCYVDELSNKVGSDGSTLIHIPAAFDAVSNAMTRDDLTADSESQWSKTLLEKHFDVNFENGRYKDDVKHNNLVQRGMAEIYLLDNQLKTSSMKASSINKQISVSSDAKSTPRSNQDSIFITRTRNREEGLFASETNKSSSRLNITSYDDAHELNMNSLTPSVQDELFVDDKSYHADGDVAESVMKDQLNFKQSFHPSKLSDDEELRIQSILHEDYNKYVDYNNFIDRKKLDEIDSKLSEFGRLDRLNDCDLGQFDDIRGTFGQQDNHQIGNTYLQEQVGLLLYMSFVWMSVCEYIFSVNLGHLNFHCRKGSAQ